MLINFTVENFRSFRSQVSLRMEATAIKELKESVVERNDYRILPVAVIYGANSSGKSNILKAMAVMRNLVIGSSKLNPGEALHFEPFMLDIDSRNKPTSFEIQFLIDGAKVRYGFSYTKEKIISEYLFVVPKGKHAEQQFFLRSEDEYDVSEKYFEEGCKLEPKTMPNRLFLTVAAQFNGKTSQKVIEWFSHFNAINGLETSDYGGYTLTMFADHKPGYKEAQKFFHDTQLGFKTLDIKQKALSKELLDSLESMPGEIKEQIIDEAKKGHIVETFTVHDIKDADGRTVKTEDFQEMVMESEGSKKIIELSGPLFDTLLNGKILLIDELDAKLHPILTRHIVKLFMNPITNRKGAQLIFNTHDTNLLNVRYFRRDQIWFTEKDKHDSTDLYSLVEFVDRDGKKIRNDNSFEKDYINGRYGAIPFIGGFNYVKE